MLPVRMWHDGSITLTVTGGTQPYKYLWSDGITTPTLADITDGTYSAVITDQNNCAAPICGSRCKWLRKMP